MARLFDNNVANYMNRATVNLGLNGGLELSVAMWVKPTTIGTDQRFLAKEINGIGGWKTFGLEHQGSSSKIRFLLQNNTLAQQPQWFVEAIQPPRTWVRVLAAWKGVAFDSTDAVLYLNGTATTTSFSATGYTAAFVLQEDTSNLYYGIRPVTITEPANAALAWVNVWNRQLTAAEALADYRRPNRVLAGLVSGVAINPDTEYSTLGGSMTVTGTLAPVEEPEYDFNRRPQSIGWPILVAG